MELQPALREIPPLLPQFLRRRRVGLAIVGELMGELGLDDRMALFLMGTQLVAMEGSYGGPVTLAQMKAYEPYATVDLFSARLALLKEKGLVEEDDLHRFKLTPLAQEASDRLHSTARAYLATLHPLPTEDMELLADRLESALEGILNDAILAPRPGSHLAGNRAMRAFGAGAPPLVRIEQAIFELWSARDDAHMKAWRDAGMQGPPMAVLTLLWHGAAASVPALVEALRGEQSPEDIESNLAYLVDREYVERDGDGLSLTPTGVLAREDIEHETDRIYFAPWPDLAAGEIAWLHDTLHALIDNLPAAPVAPPAR